MECRHNLSTVAQGRSLYTGYGNPRCYTHEDLLAPGGSGWVLALNASSSVPVAGGGEAQQPAQLVRYIQRLLGTEPVPAREVEGAALHAQRAEPTRQADLRRRRLSRVMRRHRVSRYKLR